MTEDDENLDYPPEGPGEGTSPSTAPENETGTEPAPETEGGQESVPEQAEPASDQDKEYATRKLKEAKSRMKELESEGMDVSRAKHKFIEAKPLLDKGDYQQVYLVGEEVLKLLEIAKTRPSRYSETEGEGPEEHIPESAGSPPSYPDREEQAPGTELRPPEGGDRMMSGGVADMGPNTRTMGTDVVDIGNNSEPGQTVPPPPTPPAKPPSHPPSAVSHLEASLEFEDLVNEYEVRDGPEIVVYVGEALNLYYENNSVRGKARLTRYNREYRGMKTRRKMLKLFPPKFETMQVPDNKDVKVWSIESGKYNFEYFIFKGEPALDYSKKSSYRGALKKQGIINKLSLSPELFDAVFNPIDREIMKRYKEVKKKL